VTSMAWRANPPRRDPWRLRSARSRAHSGPRSLAASCECPGFDSGARSRQVRLRRRRVRQGLFSSRLSAAWTARLGLASRRECRRRRLTGSCSRKVLEDAGRSAASRLREGRASAPVQPRRGAAPG
jgi:hypothetical protein